jgi:hypothetical protein
MRRRGVLLSAIVCMFAAVQLGPDLEVSDTAAVAPTPDYLRMTALERKQAREAAGEVENKDGFVWKSAVVEEGKRRDLLCQYQKQIDETSAAMRAQTGSKLAVDPEIERRLDGLTEEFASKHGVHPDALMAEAMEKGWLQYCATHNAGKNILEPAALTRVERADANRAVEALTLLYLNEMDAGRRPMFWHEGMTTAWCDYQTVDERRYIACQMRGIGRSTAMAYFVVGQYAGRLMVAPINGTAMQVLEPVSQLEDKDGKVLGIASYVGPAIELGPLRQAFE